MHNPFRYFNSSPEVIRLAVTMSIRYPLSLRQVEDLLFERGIDICHETVRFWRNRFGPLFAAEIRKGPFIIDRILCGDGISTRCSSGSTARRTTCGEPLITKARYSRFSPRSAGTFSNRTALPRSLNGVNSPRESLGRC